jgi:probable HAF family extracellular repeat protein
VVWVNGQPTMISGANPSAASVPEDMNDAGEIVGTLRISNREYSGVYWNALNAAFTLPTLPNGTPVGVRAHGINSLGQMVGMAQESSPNLWGHAVIWQRNSFQTDLGFMGGGNYSEAYGINDLGEVVGAATVASTAQHAFLWRNGQYTDLSTDNTSSIAYGVNLKGEIVGLNANVATVWRNRVPQALPVPAGISAFCPAIDINDASDMIATCSKGYPNDRGILWRNGQPIDLGTLPGGTISRARRISGSGEIVGEANAADGFFHAVKWTVTPAPANTTPVATIVATTPLTIPRGGSVSIHGMFTDPDSGDGPWNYSWTWGNGSTTGSATAPGAIDATRTYATRGVYRVVLRVKDARGAVGTSNVLTVQVR